MLQKKIVEKTNAVLHHFKTVKEELIFCQVNCWNVRDVWLPYSSDSTRLTTHKVFKLPIAFLVNPIRPRGGGGGGGFER